VVDGILNQKPEYVHEVMAKVEITKAKPGDHSNLF
jgi:hypothetical protein